jgi:hypothetical protein
LTDPRTVSTISIFDYNVELLHRYKVACCASYTACKDAGQGDTKQKPLTIRTPVISDERGKFAKHLIHMLLHELQPCLPNGGKWCFIPAKTEVLAAALPILVLEKEIVHLDTTT